VPVTVGADANASQPDWAGQSPEEHAAVLALRGDLEEARAASALLLAADPVNAKALLVATCVELELGNLGMADAFAARMSRLQPAPEEAPVLASLVRRRRNMPAEAMRDAIIAAWNDAGKPTIARALLPDIVLSAGIHRAIFTPEPGAVERLSQGDAFLVQAVLYADSSDSDKARAGAQASALGMHPERNSLILNLRVLSELPEGVARSRVVAALLAARPDDGLFVVMAAMEGTAENQALSLHEISRLESAARVARFGFTKVELVQMQNELRGFTNKVDPAHADLLARTIVGSSITGLSPPRRAILWFAHRVAATNGADRARAAAVAMSIGARVAQIPLELDRMLGLMLQGEGAKMANDQAAVAAVAELKRNAEEEMNKATPPRLYAWPLPSLYSAEWQ